MKGSTNDYFKIWLRQNELLKPYRKVNQSPSQQTVKVGKSVDQHSIASKSQVQNVQHQQSTRSTQMNEPCEPCKKYFTLEVQKISRSQISELKKKNSSLISINRQLMSDLKKFRGKPSHHSPNNSIKTTKHPTIKKLNLDCIDNCSSPYYQATIQTSRPPEKSENNKLFIKNSVTARTMKCSYDSKIKGDPLSQLRVNRSIDNLLRQNLKQILIGKRGSNLGKLEEPDYAQMSALYPEDSSFFVAPTLKGRVRSNGIKF